MRLAGFGALRSPPKIDGGSLRVGHPPLPKKSLLLTVATPSTRSRLPSNPAEHPASLSKNMVRLAGFEPATPGSVDQCSNPLSYRRVILLYVVSRMSYEPHTGRSLHTTCDLRLTFWRRDRDSAPSTLAIARVPGRAPAPLPRCSCSSHRAELPSNPCLLGAIQTLAERQGFEPWRPVRT